MKYTQTHKTQSPPSLTPPPPLGVFIDDTLAVDTGVVMDDARAVDMGVFMEDGLPLSLAGVKFCSIFLAGVLLAAAGTRVLIGGQGGIVAELLFRHKAQELLLGCRGRTEGLWGFTTEKRSCTLSPFRTKLWACLTSAKQQMVCC